MSGILRGNVGFAPGRSGSVSLLTGQVREGLGILADRKEWAIRLAPDAPQLAADQVPPWVWEAARSLWESKHFRLAVQAGFTSLNAHLQAKVGRRDISDDKLITEVFRDGEPKPGQPRLRVPGDPQDQTVSSRQRGALHFGLGCAFAIRNPASHEDGEWGHSSSSPHSVCSLGRSTRVRSCADKRVELLTSAAKLVSATSPHSVWSEPLRVQIRQDGAGDDFDRGRCAHERSSALSVRGSRRPTDPGRLRSQPCGAADFRPLRKPDCAAARALEFAATPGDGAAGSATWRSRVWPHGRSITPQEGQASRPAASARRAATASMTSIMSHPVQHLAGASATCKGQPGLHPGTPRDEEQAAAQPMPITEGTVTATTNATVHTGHTPSPTGTTIRSSSQCRRTRTHQLCGRSSSPPMTRTDPHVLFPNVAQHPTTRQCVEPPGRSDG